MDVEEIQRVGSNPREPNKIGQRSFCDENEGKLKMVPTGVLPTGENINMGGDMNNPLRGWHHSSRIFRVSRASGGKDRHSKVWTSKGLRDRRVRLSVTTAIQFYDLQDRLGYDQPSKAVEWLIKAAADAISELPALNTPPFPETPRQPSDEKRNSGEAAEHVIDSGEMELDEGDVNFHQNQNPHLSLSKSSSTSEASKGSGLSLLRCEIRESRGKRRERARERTAKERENANPISQNVNSSFTELLAAGGISSVNNQAAKQWSPTPMDYFGMGLLAPSSSRSHLSSGIPVQIQLGNSLSQPMSIPSYNVPRDNNHPELQHYPLVSDHIIPGATSGDYNLNFTISPGLAAGFNNNRGTLQSNSSSSILHHLQKFSPLDGSNAPFFIGTTTASSAAAQPVESHHQHHQFSSGLDGRLQLYYADGSAHSDHKGKGKN